MDAASTVNCPPAFKCSVVPADYASKKRKTSHSNFSGGGYKSSVRSASNYYRY